MAIQIELDPARNKLNEGRCHGISFAFLKPLGDGKFKCIHPISACKDYLNDIIYSELTGKPFSAYGLNTKKEGILGERGYLAMASLNTNSKECPNKGEPEGVEMLKTNLHNAAKTMNMVEKLLNLKASTIFTQVNDNLVLCEIPIEWCMSTWAISLWALMARCSVFSSGGDDWMADLRRAPSTNDRWMLDQVQSKIDLFIKHQALPIQDFGNRLHLENGVHDNGIYYYNINLYGKA